MGKLDHLDIGICFSRNQIGKYLFKLGIVLPDKFKKIFILLLTVANTLDFPIFNVSFEGICQNLVCIFLPFGKNTPSPVKYFDCSRLAPLEWIFLHPDFLRAAFRNKCVVEDWFRFSFYRDQFGSLLRLDKVSKHFPLYAIVFICL